MFTHKRENHIKRGTVREDGKVFWVYRKGKEVWATKEQYDKRIYNLSIKNLFENFFTVWTQIINDMTTLMYDNDNNKSWNNYIRILTKNDRIIYVGIMFVLVGLIMYFIFLTR